MKIPPEVTLPAAEVARSLRRIAGPGRIVPKPDLQQIELIRPLHLRPRSRLIRSLLKRLRSTEPPGLSAQSIVFRLGRTFASQGVRWKLYSDLYFFRGEGLYWNNFLTCSAGIRTFRRLERSGFVAEVKRGLRALGFRVQYAPRYGFPFDRNFPSSVELLKKAPLLAAWRPMP